MIFYLHTPNNEGGMCGSDHVPRKGELIRIDTDIVPEQNGIYSVQNVMYGIPCTPDRQRIDVYAKKASDLPKDLSWEEVDRILTPPKFAAGYRGKKQPTKRNED